MSGIDPYEYMNRVSVKLQNINTRDELITVLDEMEYLFEVLPPEMQGNAETLIGLLRTKLKNVSEQ